MGKPPPLGAPFRVDWGAVKPRVELAGVASNLLGPPSRREGKRLLWPCPFHRDRDPSFQVDLTRQTWRCWVCAVGGDAAELVMKIRGYDFPAAIAFLADIAGVIVPGGQRSEVSPEPRDSHPLRQILAKDDFWTNKLGAIRTPGGPSGLPPAEASELARAAADRLWGPSGSHALAVLRARGLGDETIRAAGLGFTPRVMIPTKAGDRRFPFSGVTIPWRDGSRLTRIKIRRLDDGKPKYAEAFSAVPLIYPDPAAVRPGRPLIISEGELDALLLGQQLPEAGVITLGSASARTDPDVLARMLAASPWFAATDADKAGDDAASRFPARARRVRPPDGKDWTELHATGRNRIRHHWGRFLALSVPWEELETINWRSDIDGSNRQED